MNPLFPVFLQGLAVEYVVLIQLDPHKNEQHGKDYGGKDKRSLCGGTPAGQETQRAQRGEAARKPEHDKARLEHIQLVTERFSLHGTDYRKSCAGCQADA